MKNGAHAGGTYFLMAFGWSYQAATDLHTFN